MRRGVGVGVGVGGPIVGATVTTGVSRPGVANGVGVWKNEVGMGVISGVGLGEAIGWTNTGSVEVGSPSIPPTTVPVGGGGAPASRATAPTANSNPASSGPRTRAGPGRPRRLVLRRQLVYTRCRRRDRPLSEAENHNSRNTPRSSNYAFRGSDSSNSHPLPHLNSIGSA